MKATNFEMHADFTEKHILLQCDCYYGKLSDCHICAQVLSDDSCSYLKSNVVSIVAFINRYSVPSQY